MPGKIRQPRRALRPRFLRLDDDHPVGAAHTIYPGVSGVLQHLDRLDVVGVYSREGTVGPRTKGYAVNGVERRIAPVERAGAPDAHRDSTAGRLLDDDTGNAPLEYFLDRFAGCSPLDL